MMRLTEWDEYGNANIIALSDVMPELYAGLSFSETNALTDALNKLAEYEDAEENGTLIRLPCKVGDETPKGAYELPRTDWQNYEVTRFDGVTQTSVYINGFDNLADVTDMLHWRECEKYETLTLSGICTQLEQLTEGHPLITVFEDAPMKCKIFQCGNYQHKHWVKLGEIQGYA